MGNLELPTNNPKQVLKMPAGSYEFGATVASMKVGGCACVAVVCATMCCKHYIAAQCNWWPSPHRATSSMVVLAAMVVFQGWPSTLFLVMFQECTDYWQEHTVCSTHTDRLLCIQHKTGGISQIGCQRDSHCSWHKKRACHKQFLTPASRVLTGLGSSSLAPTIFMVWWWLGGGIGGVGGGGHPYV